VTVLAASLRLPAQILLVGAAVILVVKAAQLLELPGAGALAALLDRGEGVANLAALLVFLVGIAIGVFLWWLADRFFSLLRDPTIPPERLASLRELPMALPEGTIRALLALIVGLVGLPILLFANALRLDAAIAGYINGIVMSVFAFYFGTRTGSGDGQTARHLAGTLTTVREEARAANERAAEAEGRAGSAAEAATRPTRLQDGIATIDRHLAAAEVLVKVLGPALPPGLIPAGSDEVLRRARQAADGARALAGGEITEGAVTAVLQAGRSLIGASPLGGLLGKAAGSLPAIGGLGPIAGVALVLGLGWQLGSAEYRRWRARVLAAPYEARLIDFGVVTPTSAEIRMERCPIFSRAFSARKREPGFFATLVDAVARDDAADRLWSLYGAETSLFASREELEAGLDEFRRALLSEQASGDVGDAAVGAVAATLGVAAPPAEAVNAAIDTPVREDAAEDQQAALEALVMMVGTLREKKVDPALLIAELQRTSNAGGSNPGVAP
jgi:hypothetical protein